MKMDCYDNNNTNDDQILLITKFFDYSERYGMGFVLNNGCVGVYYNDSSKIVLSPDKRYFQYLERKPNNQELQKYYMDCYPSELKKKVILLQYFYKHFFPHEVNAFQREPEELSPETLDFDEVDLPDLPFVKKWRFTSHAMVFQLTDERFHFILNDRSELLFLNREKFLYRSKHGNYEEINLSTVIEEVRMDIFKRLHYCENILNRISHGNTSQLQF